MNPASSPSPLARSIQLTPSLWPPSPHSCARRRQEEERRDASARRDGPSLLKPAPFLPALLILLHGAGTMVTRSPNAKPDRQTTAALAAAALNPALVRETLKKLLLGKSRTFVQSTEAGVMEEKVNDDVDLAPDNEDIEEEIEDKVLPAIAEETASDLPDAVKKEKQKMLQPWTSEPAEVDRCMARLQELQYTVAGGTKVVSGVSPSPRNTRGYLCTSILCKQETVRYVEKVPLAAEMLDVQKLQMIKDLNIEKVRFRFEIEIGKNPSTF